MKAYKTGTTTRGALGGAILGLAIFVTASPAFAEDPDPSLIENKSTRTYQVRISDNAAPVGVVKFLDATSGNVLKEIQSKDEAYALPPDSKVKMVICGSPKSKGSVIAIHVSLDLMDGAKVEKKSAAQLHFTHGQLGKKLLDPEKANVKAVAILKEDAKISTQIKNYQKAADGSLWEIKA